jgi:2,3-bisphosphoglycerate-independent phosphoglycerate mutase
LKFIEKAAFSEVLGDIMAAKANTPTMLLILDGFGYREKTEGNAIAQANMPTWTLLQKEYKHTFLCAAERYVGLPEGFMGNSEVGHLTIGAGRILRTPLCKLHDSIDNGSFFKNEFFKKKLEKLKDENRSLHIMGLLSDAGVHSHEKHLYAWLRFAKNAGLEKVYIHPFLDGRDSPPRSGVKYLEKLIKFCRQESIGKIASLHGRFYAMDRNKNWDRTKKSYDVLCGKSIHAPVKSVDVISLVEDFYSKNITDEFIEPTLIEEDGFIKEGDGIVFFNFRPDRAIQLTEAFIDPEFNKFETSNPNLSFFISTTRYRKDFENFENDILFEDESIFHTLLDEIATQKKNFPVFIAAETEKYAHVTYFFRGKVDVELAHEIRVLIPSLKVKNYVDHPEMSAEKITEAIVESLKKPAYFYLVNYANCDMVGHSGDFAATVKACECVDRQLKILYEEIVEKRDGTIFLTADHGNAEEPTTSHTKNKVPFMIINKSLKKESRVTRRVILPEEWGLSSVAPTILQYLGLAIPREMGQPILLE